ncbi:IS3 family transposase [Pseudoalteromonas prydzensis]|uniref:IS3 family transposase n=1 Tax=Pseudoalteromonas prydzensis TaxID=182141 RepID=UPI0012F7649B
MLIEVHSIVLYGQWRHYGSPWIHANLREAGEQCSVNHVATIMRQHKIKAQIGYKRRILPVITTQPLKFYGYRLSISGVSWHNSFKHAVM